MHDLPRGTVTFLFTDIEGSTRLLQQLGDRYSRVLEECRRLLRAAFQEWNGHEVDTQGDAFFVAFARATDAVSAAVDGLRALAVQSWPEDVVVRMRMGLHTGEPQLSSEGYIGIDVHHAARVMSAGHGGQVLLSQATRDLVVHQLPTGVRLRDMGEHRLKDLQRPIHLFQLVIAGLPADFPSLKTLDTSPNNLPIQPTPLIGREREVASLGQLLRRVDVRLVTLTGPGGTGKTRLALQEAAELSDLEWRGIYFVDLAPVSDSAQVIPTIASTLGLREERGRSPLECLKEEIDQNRVLLLLDNFEQVLDAAVQVSELLVACPQLKIMVTSRAVLRVRAEREFAVPTLTLPDSAQMPSLEALMQYEAIALFVQRTQAIAPEFRLTDMNAPAVVEIVSRLDGLPLAIELAAARMKLLSPETLLARLNQPLQVLTSGARDVAARQQTLRNTIEWSYTLLDAQEQELFRRLSAFIGGCTLEAIEAVYGALGNATGLILDIVASLIDKSLLQRREPGKGEEPRFAMLETIRTYGLELLAASGEMEAVRKAHAVYFMELSERADLELAASDSPEWLDRLEQEHDNLRAAMYWSLEDMERRKEIALRLGGALRSFWYSRGYLSEGLDFLERALVGSDEVEEPVGAAALYAAARLYEVRGDYDRAEPFLVQSLALYRRLGNPARIAYALHLQADIAWRRGILDTARSLAQESLAVFRELGDRGAIASLLLHLGALAADQGEYAKARDLLEKSLAINRELGDKSSIADSLFNLARANFFSGRELGAARVLLEESLSLFRQLSDKESIGYCLCLQGLLTLEQGDVTAARSLVEQSVALFKERRQAHGIALSTSAMATVIAAQGDNAVARALYEESLILARKAGDKLIIASGLEGLSRVLTALGEYEWAIQLRAAAETLREAMGAPLPAVERPAAEQAAKFARERLGEEAFAAVWDEWRGLKVEDALNRIA
jgi:predicted ATPase/class 3 adenylate cyclase